jgi:hypothetical protein
MNSSNTDSLSKTPSKPPRRSRGDATWMWPFPTVAQLRQMQGISQPPLRDRPSKAGFQQSQDEVGEAKW